MIECLHNLLYARRVKRQLVSSLLTDPEWKPINGCSSHLAKGDVTVSLEGGDIHANGIRVRFPLIGNCCIKRAARQRALKMLAAALSLLVLVGCAPAPPAQLPPGEYYPILAAAIGLAVDAEAPDTPPQPGPAPPNPTPNPSPTTCPNCNGTGKLGDGRVSVVCPVCDGTGKVTTAEAAWTASAKAWLVNERKLTGLLDELQHAKIENALLGTQAKEHEQRIKTLEETAKKTPVDKTIEKIKAEREPFETVSLDQAPAKAISWHTVIKPAREQATKEDRPMLVCCGAPWCGPCRNRETQVFENARVQRELPNVAVLVKLNIDDQSEQFLLNWFDVKSKREIRIPYDVVTSPDYQKRIRIDLSIDPDKYLERVSAAAREVQAYIDGKKSVDVAKPVARPVSRPTYYQPPMYFGPSYGGSFSGGSCSGGSCSSGNCGGGGFW